jgi:hypothetical protein
MLPTAAAAVMAAPVLNRWQFEGKWHAR